MLLEKMVVADDDSYEGVKGHKLKVNSVAGGYFASKSSFPAPRFAASSAIKFRIKGIGTSVENPVFFEFQAYAEGRKAWRWRKVSISSNVWQTVELPTRYFRHSPNAYLSWKDTRRFAFLFRNSGSIELDSIELVDAHAHTFPSELSLGEISLLAFNHKGTIHQQKNFAILSDEPRLNSSETFSELDRLLKMILKDFPGIKATNNPIPLLVFSKEKRFRTFWTDLALKFNSQGPVPTSDGYAMLGVAGSFYDSSQGSVRPVFLHEACHALIARIFGIASNGNWLQEGLANHYQLRLGNKNTKPFAKNLLKMRRIIPLSKLLDGNMVAIEHYSQTALVIEWMISTRKDLLFRAIRAMAENGSLNIKDIAHSHFGKNISELEKEWILWLKSL